MKVNDRVRIKTKMSTEQILQSLEKYSNELDDQIVILTDDIQSILNRLAIYDELLAINTEDYVTGQVNRLVKQSDIESEDINGQSEQTENQIESEIGPEENS